MGRVREMIKVDGRECWTLAMQQCGIRPIPDEERLDLSRYCGESIEF